MIRFSVDPNYAGKNLPGWFMVASYLQKSIGQRVKFIPYKDFDEARNAVLSGEIDIVYANPFDWVFFMNEIGFLPIARPRNHFDEVIICSKKYKSYLELTKPINIISAHKKTFVHMVGLFLLEKAEIDLDSCKFNFSGSYQSVIKNVLQSEYDIGFVLSEVYEKSSVIIKNQLNILDVSNDGFVFHAFCISPRLIELQKSITESILNFNSKLLDDIGFEGFETISEDEIFTISSLANEYIGSLNREAS
ncbi:MAG: phosphate/phosphite/phosphonate ABC transporter substrate-binding protein [Desulfurella sp.]|uniref:Phosphonate transport system substrate-binding protein n=1 Tax=Desulfurella multipotens TaxID=79269 RepID=A0A1G6MBF2_9BACT|nr:phosphate/phosphite/phosphonate ABC transporter substrate-binding protein [Desulfurella multipotens]SDC52902.1 phosphonate transport system substrate-binding protein [Desulfurella multipotens]